MISDSQIFNLITKEHNRQVDGIELIASENFVSAQVLKAQGSILTNKYAEGLPGKRYYGGCEIVDQIEQLAIDRAKQLFGASWVNVQPHSGAQANAAVMLAVLKAGDGILGLDLAQGGHLSHGSPVNLSGKFYKAHFYGVHRDSFLINYDEMEDVAQKNKPKLIVCGASAYSRDWDYPRIRSIADNVGALVLADISHPSGLIAKGLLNSPFEHCHIVTTTTHKTLRGPRGGMIMIGKDFENPWGLTAAKGRVKMLSELLDSSVFPGTQGGPLEHVIAAKAVSFGEALNPEFLLYAKQIITNAKAMALALISKGYEVITGGTDNHMFLVDLKNKNITGKQAEEKLGLAGITVNKNMIPYDDKSAINTSGIRIGTSAVTTRGMFEFEMLKIAELIDEALHVDLSQHDKLSSIKTEVRNYMTSFPLFSISSTQAIQE